jgi:hypothetical protein
MKCFVVTKRFLPEVAALICFVLVTATDASATTTHLILYAALAIILAIKFGPERLELSRQKRRDRAKELPAATRSKGSR